VPPSRSRCNGYSVAILAVITAFIAVIAARTLILAVRGQLLASMPVATQPHPPGQPDAPILVPVDASSVPA
jgi:hypothetical protein